MKYKITTNEIRRKWLDFFVNKNHLEIESKSLIPINDNSLLWINSGVATLKKFFSGVENPPSNKLVNSQRCIRTNDIENVGLTSRHHTFFEMLGNFSIGDYFRKEAIEFAAEFLLKNLNIDSQKLYVTVYENDEESYNLWIKNGILKNHIIKCDKSRNFWEIGAGPCGPCTEIYYDRGTKYDPDNIGEKLFFEDIENDRYIEIWNIVFSEFNNDGKNNYTKLARQNIDTGAGLERLACILQEVNTNYDTDGFVKPRIILEQYSTHKYDDNLYFEKNKDETKTFINKSFVVIIDHIKACLFAISDGALPSNKDRGYILRKLLRRAFFHMDFLRIEKKALNALVDKLIEINHEYYPYLKESQSLVIETLEKEYISYKTAIKNSLKFLEELLVNNQFNEQNLFKLVDTFGFPIEIINELELSKNNQLKIMMLECLNDSKKSINLNELNIDFEKFNKHFDEHRKISKGNKEIVGMQKQNAALLQLEIDSIFDYEKESFDDSKVIKLFDENFNEVNELNQQNGFFVLDKTCMYATSGGQVNDIGFINGFIVDDVFKNANGINIHHVVDATLKNNEIVKISHDVKRRNMLRAHHSSEHLLHSALKNEISDSIKQEGALKSPDKFTFDFYYPKKLTFDQIIKIENNVKKVIDSAYESKTILCTLKQAQDIGALAYFEDVYKKIKGLLRVVQLSDKSIEICGGTHVKNTKDIYDFKIINLVSKGSGSWRIEAISGKDNIDKFNSTIYLDAVKMFDNLKKELLNSNELDEQISQILNKDIKKIHYLELKNDLDILKNTVAIFRSKNQKNLMQQEANKLKNSIISNSNKLCDGPIFLDEIDRKLLTVTLTNVINESNNKLFFVFNNVESIYQYIICGNEKLCNDMKMNLNIVAKTFNNEFGGKGGGRNNFVQGSLKTLDKQKVNEIINTFLKQYES